MSDPVVQIRDALLRCRAIQRVETRTNVLEKLPEYIRNALPGTSSSSSVTDIVDDIVDACNYYPNGIRDLIEAVRGFEGPSKPMQTLDQLITKLFAEQANSQVNINNEFEARPILPLRADLVSFEPDIFAKSHLAEIQKILMQVTLTKDDVQKAYWQSAPDGWPYPAASYEPSEIPTVLTHLAGALRQHNKTYPLLLFAAYLIQGKSEINSQFMSWIMSIRDDLRLDTNEIKGLHDIAGAPALSNQAGSAYLLVTLKPLNPAATQFFVQAWLLGSPAGGALIEHGSSQDETQRYELDDVPSLLDELIQYSSKHLPGPSTQLVIELFLPDPRLCHNIDDWYFIPHGEEGVPMRFVIAYPMVVRSLDRLYGKASLHNAWQKKWSLFKASMSEGCWLCGLQQNPEGNQWYKFQQIATSMTSLHSTEASKREELMVKLEEHINLIALTFAPSSLSKDQQLALFSMILGTGVPIALWPKDATNAPEDIQTAIAALLNGQDLRELPTLVWKERRKTVGQEAHVMQRLTILFDNAERLPPEQEPDTRLRVPFKPLYEK